MVFYLIRDLLCSPDQNRIIDGDWRNSTFFSLPHFTECVQHLDFSWFPALFLLFFCPVVLYDLHMSINPKSRSLSPITYRISICVILVIDLTVSFFYNLSQYFSNKDAITLQYLVGDFLQYIGLCVALVLLIASRNRGLVTSGVLFLYWLLMTLCGLPEFRYLLDQKQEDARDMDMVRFVLYLIYFPLVCLQLLLSCFADSPASKYNGTRECPELHSSFINQITFGWFTGLAVKGHSRPLEQSDLWNLNERDTGKVLIEDFEKHFQPEMKKYQALSERSLVQPVPEEKHPSVLFPIFATYKFSFAAGALYKLCFDLLQFAAPELLRQLIGFIQDREQPVWVGVAIAIAMFLVALIQSMILHQYFHMMFRLGMNIKSVLTSAVYKKAINLSNNARKTRSVGEIVNLMSVDIQRLQDMTSFVMLFWSAPLQIILAVFFLWRLLGVAVIAGLVILIAMFPLNWFISIKMRDCQVEQMKHKDQRLKLMSEILNGIKVLKLYAWEKSMQKMILDIREKEIIVLKKLAYLNAATTLSWACAPFLVAVLTFGVYVTIDSENNVLTPEVTFVALSLFNILRFPLAVCSMIVTQAVQCSVSNKRLKAFFAAEEMNTKAIENRHNTEIAIHLTNGNFSWDNGTELALANLNLSVKKGSLVAVVGRVGSGKSSLLQAILGEMNKVSGNVNVCGTIAYVPQHAWIQNMSLKANILFNRNYDTTSYNEIISACALEQDIASLPAGDNTEIGEKGINLSGGQKQRVSLARSVYSHSEIVLLDDPLSAVDAHVGKHIFENVISSSTGLLAGTTRILVTHGLHYLKYCDQIIVLKEGQVSETGTYRDLMTRQGAFSELIEEFLVEEAKNRGRSVSFGENASDVTEILHEIDKINPGRRKRIESQISQEIEQLPLEAREKSKSPDLTTHVVNGKAAKEAEMTQTEVDVPADEKAALLGENNEKTPPTKGKLIEKESVETGKVSWAVYLTYIRAIGVEISILFIATYIFSSVLGVGCNLWLARWSDDAKAIQGASDGETTHRLGIYAALGMGQAMFVCAASIIMALGMVRASRGLHEGMLTNCLHSPMSFFDTTPLGRIVNRFGKDIEAIDATLPNSVRTLVSTLFVIIATLSVITWATPFVLIPFVVIAFFYVFIVEVDVLDSRLPSAILTFVGSIIQAVMILFVPIYATPPVALAILPVIIFYIAILDIDCLDNTLPRSLLQFVRTLLFTIEVLVVISWATPLFVAVLLPLCIGYFAILRFYVSTSRQLKRLESASRSPIFSHFQESIQGASSIRAYNCMDKFVHESQKKVDDNLATYYPSIVANRWLAVRLELVGNMIVLFAGLFAALNRDSPGLTAGLVGLSVSYALNITQTLNWAVRMTSELETNIVAVERINEYTNTPTEGKSTQVAVPRTWPSKGEIRIKNYSLRYREGLDLVLRDVTAHIEPMEKIGIVGRTGAGKSSLTLALFRIVEADGGMIEIDGQNIADLALEELRSRLTIVPQDPVLFSGTLRVNLDPFYAFDDSDIWTALRNAHLEAFVTSLPDRLNHAISEGGENLSVGQRQLLCLARALLRKTRILILDEAAAAVDVETDSLLQRTIREQFKDCTVLTIAHRLNTVMDSDRMLVLDKGQVVEFGPPKVLLSDTESVFHSMAVDAGIA